MSKERIEPFSKFYPYYLTEHEDRTNKVMHFIGTTLVIFVFVAAILSGNYKWLWFCPLLGYGFAWPGHMIFEKNKPATFRQPIYSLMSDFVMWWDIIRGRVKL